MPALVTENSRRKTLQVIPCALGLLSCLIFPSNSVTELLQFDRTAITAGQFWRLFTGHWTHWNAEHLIWDVIPFVGLAMLCTKFDSKGFLTTLIVAGLFISLGVLAFLPDMALYRGLSGFDSALFLFAATWLLMDNIRDRQWLRVTAALLSSIAFVLKISYEAITKSTLFVQSTDLFLPVPLAHLIGALSGILVALIRFYVIRKDNSHK